MHLLITRDDLLVHIASLMHEMSDPQPPDKREPASDPPAGKPAPEEQIKTWESTDLLGDEAEAVILNRGQKYRLHCTKQGKLILYK